MIPTFVQGFSCFVNCSLYLNLTDGLKFHFSFSHQAQISLMFSQSFCFSSNCRLYESTSVGLENCLSVKARRKLHYWPEHLLSVQSPPIKMQFYHARISSFSIRRVKKPHFRPKSSPSL